MMFQRQVCVQRQSLGVVIEAGHGNVGGGGEGGVPQKTITRSNVGNARGFLLAVLLCSTFLVFVPVNACQ